VVILRPKSNGLADLAPYAEQYVQEIANARPGQIVRIAR
jgi:hypothetical protein